MKNKNPFSEQRKENMNYATRLVFEAGKEGLKSKKLLALISVKCGITRLTASDYVISLKNADVIKAIEIENENKEIEIFYIMTTEAKEQVK
ncbi:hypothetical protein LCGC14_1236070 [marine sediment metagenome]|uniref:HTH iclR-type domain-containing protein n=1 Tax=marine sediment metagenome TaxID=412755 RepID=A0A0F9PBE3_9ZZZZ